MADRERMFRDETGAAFERIAALEAENAELRARLAGRAAPNAIATVTPMKAIALVLGVVVFGGVLAAIAMPRPAPTLVAADPQFAIPARPAATPVATPFAAASQVPEPGVPVTLREITLDVRGPYPKDVIADGVHANERRVRDCYADALADKPDLKGTVGVRFDVGARGEVVSAAESAGDLREPAVVTCIVRAIGMTTFSAAIPPEKGITSVTYSVALAPGPPPLPPRPVVTGVSPVFFDRGAVAQQLGAVNVQSCKRADGPTGSGHVKITFGADGTVQTVIVDSAPFAGTPVGACVENRYRTIRIPPFSGPNVSVGKSFTVL